MKILYIITGLGLGGAETITVNIANSIKSRGHDIVIMSLTGNQEVSVSHDIPVYNMFMKKNPLGLLKTFLQAKKIVHAFKPDIIHAHMFHAVIFARMLKIISTEHNKIISTEHTNSLGAKVRMLLYRVTDFLSDLNTNVSKEATDYFIKEKAFSEKKSRPIYNGIDLSRFQKNNKGDVIRAEYGLKSDDFVYINVARLMPAKDHYNLLKAFSLVPISSKKLLLVGKGELESSLRNFVQELGIQDLVFFCGAHSNIEDYYNAADCFVLSSEWEGFGLVLAEAMSCELPVISTNCGGTSEVVQNSHFLVPPKTPSALASKMQEIALLSQQERIVLGQENRYKIKKFDIEYIIDTWLEIYEGL